jgi:general secretion pathway protein N
LTALSATRERPIFSPSRRPPPPQIVAAPHAPPPKPPPPAPPPEPDHPLLTLLGTLAGNTMGVGIFIDQNDNAPVSLRIGEAHRGWVLRAVRARETVFEKSDRTATLALPSPEQPGPAAAPANRTPMPAPKLNSDFWNR